MQHINSNKVNDIENQINKIIVNKESHYRNMSDDELIKIAKSDKSQYNDAISVIYSRYYNLIRNVTRMCADYELNDAMQDAYLLLHDIVIYWQCDRTQSIATLYRYRLITMCKKWLRDNNNDNVISCESIENWSDVLADQIVDDRLDADVEKAQIKDYIDVACDQCLTSREHNLVMTMLKHNTLQFCNNKSTAYRTYNRAIIKLQQYFKQ